MQRQIGGMPELIANAKLAGISTGTFGVGAWTWLGDNQSELGALASLFGIVGISVSLWRSRQ